MDRRICEIRLTGTAAQVQPPVVQQEWRIIGRSLLRQVCNELRALVFGRNVFHMYPQNDIAHEFAVLVGVLENRGSGFSGGLDFEKSGASKTFRGALRILIKPGLVETHKEGAKFLRCGQRIRPLAKGEHVRPASTLGFQPSSWNKRPAQVRKKL